MPFRITSHVSRLTNKSGFSSVYLVVGVLLIILLAGGAYYLYVQKSSPSPSSNTQLANPASVNCTKQGGKLVIKTRGDGGQFGLCEFEDDQACEEWALMRGECPAGGVKTTGFDNIYQKYCAWAGGQTLAVNDANCKLPNGNTCKDIDFYNGKCS